MGQCLRVGFVLTDKDKVPAWYFETIQSIITKGYSPIFILCENFANKKAAGPFMYRLFTKFETAWFGSEHDAGELRSAEALFNDDNTIRIQAKRFVTDATNLSLLRKLQLDIIYSIDLTAGEPENFSEAAAYGLWSIEFGFGKYSYKKLPAFWEVMDDSPITGSQLLVYKNGEKTIAYEGTTRTIPYSVKNNFNSIAWRSASYLEHRAKEIEQAVGFVPQHYSKHIDFAADKRGFPSNLLMAYLIARNVFGYLQYKLTSKFNRGKFTLLYALHPFSLDTFQTIKFQAVDLPPDSFFADPFVVEKEGINYIFFEEYIHKNNKAHLSVIKVEKSGVLSSPKIVLEKPYHLSYPFVFEWEGSYYMVPETTANKTVELYKASAFPDQWEFVMFLMKDVPLFDVTLHFESGKWWLFANSSNHPFTSTNDQLFLFYNNDLFSTDWKPHLQNPVATQAGNCRPAGRIFRINNKLYRPAQNNASQQYGYGLKINEIENLSETVYAEKEVSSIEPKDMGLRACHHIGFSDSIMVIDGIVKNKF